ncbi:hypothetical protein BDZ97DRAFT_1916053 [Flammula alnicola]|nr:hypothetical protein BDZ97DRAFT_1916053 [Flammula alnicola]
MEIGFLWLKDSTLKALTIATAGLSGNTANFADTKNRIKVLDGWIYNVAHVKNISNEAWFTLINSLKPVPANVENRFVRLCNTYDDLIGFLSFGALGEVPPPSFCPDMSSSPKPQSLRGPIPSVRKARKDGCVVWGEVETRAYLIYSKS